MKENIKMSRKTKHANYTLLFNKRNINKTKIHAAPSSRPIILPKVSSLHASHCCVPKCLGYSRTVKTG